MDLKKRDNLILALLTEPTKRKACKKAGVSETMLYHDYMKNPEFLQAYNQAKKDLIESATRELQNSLLTSAKTLHEIVKNPEEKTQDRITSARIILDYGMRFTEELDILERLERLEGAQNEE